MSFSIWESSVIKAKRSQNSRLRIQRSQIKSSLHKDRLVYTPCTQPSSKSKSFFFETQKLNNRLNLSPENQINHKTLDSSEATDRHNWITEKLSLEKYMNDIEKDERSQFIVHNFARPRRLIAVKSISPDRNNTGKNIEAPIIRLGMTGWKLLKPKSASRGVELRSNLKYRNKMLEIVSKKII